jgi:hypothetical protein
VYPKDSLTKEQEAHNLLRVVYDKGIKTQWPDFDTMRKRINTQWHKMPKSADTQSPALKQLIIETIADHKKDEQHASELLAAET